MWWIRNLNCMDLAVQTGEGTKHYGVSFIFLCISAARLNTSPRADLPTRKSHPTPDGRSILVGVLLPAHSSLMALDTIINQMQLT